MNTPFDYTAHLVSLSAQAANELAAQLPDDEAFKKWQKLDAQIWGHKNVRHVEHAKTTRVVVAAGKHTKVTIHYNKIIKRPAANWATFLYYIGEAE